MTQTPIQLDEIDRKLLAQEAARVGSSMSAIIRRLIREHLRRDQQAAR
jgi:hypothetical protein